MADTWKPEPQAPLGEILFGPEEIAVEIVGEMDIVPLILEPLTAEQQKQAAFLDRLDWSCIPVFARRNYYERALRNVVRKSSSRR